MTRLLLLLALAAPAFAADAPPRTEADILKSVKLPEGYEATVFAMPPQGGYPTACSAAIDGTLFVAVDENGSLDNKPNRGRVVRMRDTDGDGKADEFKVFAEMDSPRGVTWDGPSGTGPGTLYVMHPPNLTAYTDTDGDGKSDKQEEILTGLGFDLKFRGADHTTNGSRLAIDGFIYIAVGDYGFTKATAKDGTALTMRGGGIVRIRPDGTGFEIVSHGQRNIYDVAVSPTLDLFTRDNTNDGGGWDVRLSHVPPGAHMGYPTLFKNFAEDMVQPLAVLGGGSPCGALWIDEPGLQNGLYTVEWGRNAIMYHPLKPKGATFEQEQKEWLKMTRPTDMDVDASGAIFITSWEGATFNYAGPNAGYVLRVVKKNAKAERVPNLANKTPEQLAGMLTVNSGVLRLAASREFVRVMKRLVAEKDPRIVSGTYPLSNVVWDPIFKAAPNPSVDPAPYAAFLFTLSDLIRVTTGRATTKSSPFPASPEAQRLLLLQQADPNQGLAFVSFARMTESLRSDFPRVRAAAITALRRLGKTDAAQAMLPLVADADPIVAHLAVRALGELKASAVCLAALDSSDAKLKPGALRALYGIYEPAVVDGLIARLGGTKDAALRRGILNTLCRLDNKDAAYVDPKVWWGTRPDTSGPVYKPERWEASEKIEAALKVALDSANDEEARWLVQRMYLTKVNYPGLIQLMLTKAGNDTAAKLTAIEGLFGPENTLPAEAATALKEIATGKEVPDLRAKSLRLLQRGASHGAVFPIAVAAFAPLAGNDPGHASLAAAFEDFTRDAKNTKWTGDFAKLAEGADAAKRTLAQTVLVNLATSALVKGKDKEKAEQAVEKGWAKPETAASLLGVIARTGAKAYAEQVKAKLNDPNNAVAESALFAFQKLGLKDTGSPAKLIGTMKYEEVFAAVQKGGDAAQGKEMYLRAGCIACHTVSADEPPKGPVLTAAAKIYDRAALTESLLKPNAKIAQGFESVWFKTKKAGQVEGFITREGGDSVDVRNIVGQTVTIEKGDVVERGKREISMMPEGLLAGFSPVELANLLAYLESLKGK